MTMYKVGAQSVSHLIARPAALLQVERQDERGEDSAEHEEGQPGLEERGPAHMFPMNERQRTQVHHVPRCAVVVAHEVQGHGHVGMAVIKAQIVRPAFVFLRCIVHCFVPCSCTTTTDFVNIKLPILCWSTKPHIVLRDKVGSCKISYHSRRSAYAHVTNEGEHPR